MPAAAVCSQRSSHSCAVQGLGTHSQSTMPDTLHLQECLSGLQVPTQLVPLVFAVLAAWDGLADTLLQIMPAGKFWAVTTNIACRLLSPAASIWVPPRLCPHMTCPSVSLCTAAAVLLLAITSSLSTHGLPFCKHFVGPCACFSTEAAHDSVADLKQVSGYHMTNTVGDSM